MSWPQLSKIHTMERSECSITIMTEGIELYQFYCCLSDPFLCEDGNGFSPLLFVQQHTHSRNSLNTSWIDVCRICQIAKFSHFVIHIFSLPPVLLKWCTANVALLFFTFLRIVWNLKLGEHDFSFIQQILMTIYMYMVRC